MRDFSALLKIKKEELKGLEIEIQRENQKRDSVKEDIENLYTEISKFSLPKSGNISEINALKESVYLLNEEIKRKKDFLKEIDLKIEKLKEDYQELSVEYEKIKYLNEVEEKKRKEAKEEKERKELDDIASILFARRER
ncbi:MAG: hypothetical protein GXO31_03815 [Epsilonproteobacteria bacterium]|nr:hypothetical protein [Campylobacterota bacterium]